MSTQTISISTDARGVATLLLNRPDKHNALSAPMMDELTEAAHALGADDSVRVVVMRGAGASFCAGGDLRWMQDQMASTPEVRGQSARKLAMMLSALNEMPKPLIAAVHGAAFGGGVGMACVADVAIGVQGAKFGLTETRLGITPATIGPYVVARLGEAMARRVFMSSRRFGADEAVTLGVIAKAVAAHDLDAALEAEVGPYLSCAPGAVAEAKALVRHLGAPINDAVIDHTIAALVKRWDSDEAQEGIGAFFDKRTPSWQS